MLITIFILILSIFILYSFVKNNFRMALIAILLLGIGVRIFMASDLFLHNWDERFHAVIAKNIIDHPLKPTLYDTQIIESDFKDWTKSHVWLSKPPLTFWVIGTSLSIFGNNELGLRLPSILISLFCVFLTYLIGASLFNRKVGIIAAYLHAIHGLSVELAGGLVSSDHVDTLFLFFFEIAIYFAIRSIDKQNLRNVLSIGFFMGLAYMCKWIMAFFVLFIWLGFMLVKVKTLKQNFINVFWVCTSFLVVALPWHFYMSLHFPEESAWMMQGLVSPLGTAIQGHNGTVLFYIDKIRILFGEIIYLPLFWILYKFRSHRNSNIALLVIWTLIPLVLLSFASTKRYTYIMMCAPAFFILTAFFVEYLRRIKFKKYTFLKPILIVLLMGLPIRYSLERVKPFKERLVMPTWRTVMEQVKENNVSEKILILNEPHYLDAMFYYDFIAYENGLSQEQVLKFKREGFKVYENKDGVYFAVE